jgi:hypothetical protein
VRFKVLVVQEVQAVQVAQVQAVKVVRVLAVQVFPAITKIQQFAWQHVLRDTLGPVTKIIVRSSTV